jgi:hypothetical protein
MQTRAFMGGILLLGLLLSCSEERPATSVCVGDDARCGGACSVVHPCAAGLYCDGNQLCSKECDDSHECPRGGACTSTGQCQPKNSGGEAGSRADAGARPLGAGGFSNPGLTPDAAEQAFDPMGPGVCASSNVVAGRVIPTVILIIDQSGSMHDSIGQGTRWNVLRDFLLDQNGLIKSLEGRMRFGISMYSARSEEMNGMPVECPIVTSVAPALDNFAAIEQAYRAAEPIDDTPTGDSIDKIIDGLPPPAPDAVQDPIVFILATDGEPDRCEEPEPQNGQAETIAAVSRAYGMNIKTFVIGVGADISTQHQQDVANAGVGHAAGDPNAMYWTAENDATLRQALMEIINAQVSCEVKLKGKVEGDACQGTVRLSGELLECDQPDGWELVDETHVRLLGQACEQFRSSQVATLDVTFPCGVVFVE